MKQVIAANVHQQVLEECVDIPQQQPATPLVLNEVGISNKTVWVQLPAGLLPFEAKLHVTLDAGVRGIHMSRMEEVITELHGQPFADLAAYGMELGRRMLACQEGERGRVELRGKLPLKRQGVASGKLSVDALDISAAVALKKGGGGVAVERCIVGVAVHHITACPCTQAYNRVLFGQGGGDWPLPTHSQRSCTRLLMEASNGQPDYEELLGVLEESLHVTQDLLKRHDEAEIVLKSHSAPQFAEDAVRDTARVAAQRFRELPPTTAVEIESLSLESIHIHDVHCRLVTTLGDIRQQLGLHEA